MQDEGIDLLTPRERECLRLVYEHLSSKQIGRRLGISKHTVDTHLDKARQRLGAEDRYDAARRMALYERNGGIPIESGPDANGMVNDGDLERDHPEARGIQHDHPGIQPSDQDGEADGVAEGGAGLISRELARIAAGTPDADVHLGADRAAARGPLGLAGPGGAGAGAGVGGAQAVALQAARDGAARNLLPGVDLDGRIVLAGPAAWGAGGNALGPLARLGLIVLIAIASALAFGGVLAGLHALKDLV
jgi:DNA-binding CsgD family transcriptional regulator